MDRRRRHSRFVRFAYRLTGIACLALLAHGAATQPLAEADLSAEHASSNDFNAAEIERRGFDYLLGRGVPIDLDEARRLLEQAAAAGRPLAQGGLADLFWDGDGVPEDRERAMDLYRGAAERGFAWAQRRVGWAYLYGDGVQTDFAQARRWLTAAADQEDAFALYFLSQMYAYGSGIERNADYAIELLTRAAELGCPPAMRDLGSSLLYDSPLRDIDMGLYLLERAARRDDAVSAYILGQEYLDGSNVGRDFALAEQWLSVAADLDHRLAALWLAEIYDKGLGVEPDAGRAASLRSTALSVATSGEKNAFAWELSVHTNELLRNGVLAVEIMEETLQDPEQRAPAYLDTLAAAHAEAGQFDDAVTAELEALAALRPSSSQQTRSIFSERLELYRSGKAYHR